MKAVALLMIVVGLIGTVTVLISPSVITWRVFGHEFTLTMTIDPHLTFVSMPVFLGGFVLWFLAARREVSQLP